MTPAPARPAPSPTARESSNGADTVVRGLVLLALVLAPLLSGVFHYSITFGLFIIGYACGLFVLVRKLWFREPLGLPPGTTALGAFFGLITLQLMPLPPYLLRLVSPGTFAFHERRMLVPLTEWKPVSVSPADTAFGLVYLAGTACFFFAVFDRFAEKRWRRLLLRTVIYIGLFMTMVALVQEASGTHKIYGIFEMPEDWAVFGPYLNRSNMAAYLLMPAFIALGFTAETLAELARAWSRRPSGWLVMGEPVGSTFVRRAAEAMVLVVGIVASGSRGAFGSFALALLVIAVVLRKRLLAGVILLVGVLSTLWIGLETVLQGFANRGLEQSRLGLWRDAVRMVPDFPLLGTGFNAFTMAYLYYQTFWHSYFFSGAHNEYLELLVTTGLVGVALALWGVVLLLRPALARSLRSPLDAGLLAGLLGLACNNLSDFNWQIPPNAVTFAALLAVAVQPLDPRHSRP